MWQENKIALYSFLKDQLQIATGTVAKISLGCKLLEIFLNTAIYTIDNGRTVIPSSSAFCNIQVFVRNNLLIGFSNLEAAWFVTEVKDVPNTTQFISFTYIFSRIHDNICAFYIFNKIPLSTSSAIKEIISFWIVTYKYFIESCGISSKTVSYFDRSLITEIQFICSYHQYSHYLHMEG